MVAAHVGPALGLQPGDDADAGLLGQSVFAVDVVPLAVEPLLGLVVQADRVDR